MKWKVNLGLSVFLLAYILVGALVFHVLEHKTYIPADIADTQFYKDFLASHPNVTAAELEQFTREVVRMTEQTEQGVVVREENVTEQDNGWSYDNAVYFTITVVSTIGYGHITPKTNGGKWFCIFFALLGIPMAMALLASVGSKLRKITDRLQRTRPWCRNNAIRDRRVKSGTVLTMGTVLMVCIPALVFMFTEDWSYLTALYYSTITLTTVGFGDYVAGDGKRSEWFRILVCLWLVIGLAYLALIISEVSELYSGIHTRLRKPKKPSGSDDSPQPDENAVGKDTVNVDTKPGTSDTVNVKL